MSHLATVQADDAARVSYRWATHVRGMENAVVRANLQYAADSRGLPIPARARRMVAAIETVVAATDRRAS